MSALRELFAKSKKPSHDDQESAAQTISHLLSQAQDIGTALVDKAEERGMAWGGAFKDILSSAWDIVTNFVQRIGDWISEEIDDGEEITLDDIVAKVDALAETVASVEIPSAVEGAVLDAMETQGLFTIRWIAQPGACKICRDNADLGSVPIGYDFDGTAFPPAHPGCRCVLGQ